MFRLYTTPLSANGRKPLALCHHLGLSPEIEIVDVYRGEGRRPEYLAVNPWGKVPTLVDGDFRLWESNAILQYVAETHGDYRLTSRDPKVRADILRWMFWESAHWQPTLIPVLSGFAAELLRGGSAKDAPPVSWGEPSVQVLLETLDLHLESTGYMVGTSLTLADLSIAGMMTYARVADFPFVDFTHIAAWYARIEALEAWEATSVAPWR